jgi:hypothetical protein
MARSILSLMCVVSLAGCAAAQPPASEPAAVPVVVQPMAPASQAQPPVIAEAATPQARPAAADAVTGVAACDEYLAAYKRCEKLLEPSIAAGDARTWKSEAAWLQYLKGTPEGAGLPESCAASLRALRGKCKP